LQWDQIAVMGDDWPDLPLLTRAGLAVAPANAHAEVKAIAHHVSPLRGGQGAARECCDLLLWATGRYDALLHGHLETLDTTSKGPSR
jgi:3-deoxy-D-manno-octulosonate 8-phosphate phosphatase (KDO 8-P phosphatase)